MCVELAAFGSVIGVRDSKNPEAGHLNLRTHELAELLDRAKSGALDL